MTALTLAAVLGQLLASVLCDQTGLTAGGRRGVTPGRITGLALACLAVAVGVLSLSADSWLLLLGVLAAAGFLVQQVGIGRLREATGEPVPAALAPVALGAVVLLVALALSLPVSFGGFGDVSPAFWCGGLIGAAILMLVLFTISRIGAFGMALTMTIGQALGAVAIDTISPVPGDVPLSARLLSIGLLLAAATLNEASRRESE